MKLVKIYNTMYNESIGKGQLQKNYFICGFIDSIPM